MPLAFMIWMEVLVFDDPVVVHCHQHEDHVAAGIKVEGPHRVVEEAEARVPERRVARDASLHEEGLRYSHAGGGLYVGGEHSPVEGIPRPPVHEEAAETA